MHIKATLHSAICVVPLLYFSCCHHPPYSHLLHMYVGPNIDTFPENKYKKLAKIKHYLVFAMLMDLIHYSFAPLILFSVPYTLNLLP